MSWNAYKISFRENILCGCSENMIAYIAAFLSGLTIMAVELIASRWLAPLFGFTLSTWTILIAVTLLACSVGAWLGGMMSLKLKSWRGIGYCFLSMAFWLIILYFGFLRLKKFLIGVPLLFGATIGTLILVAPPVIISCMILPFLIELRHEKLAVGLTAGRLSASSALGSLIGTLGTGLWLIHFLGLRNTTLLLAMLLGTFGMLLVIKHRLILCVYLALVVSSGIIIMRRYPAQLGVSRLIKDTPYGTIELLCTPYKVSLWINGILQSGYSPLLFKKGVLLINRNYFELLPYLYPQGHFVLHIGLGAGLVPRCLKMYGFTVDNVELNPSLARLVHDYLGFQDPILVGDGRCVIRTLKKCYDFVILDVFNGEEVASHMMTQEAFLEIRNKLSPE